MDRVEREKKIAHLNVLRVQARKVARRMHGVAPDATYSLVHKGFDKTQMDFLVREMALLRKQLLGVHNPWVFNRLKLLESLRAQGKVRSQRFKQVQAGLRLGVLKRKTRFKPRKRAAR